MEPCAFIIGYPFWPSVLRLIRILPPPADSRKGRVSVVSAVRLWSGRGATYLGSRPNRWNKLKSENLFAERKVVTGASNVSCDFSAHFCAAEGAKYLLTYKKDYGMLPGIATMKTEAASANLVEEFTIPADAGMTCALRRESPTYARERSQDADREEERARRTT